MQANSREVYENNSAASRRWRAGEIDVGFVNHYYLFQSRAESGDTLPVANHYSRAATRERS